MSKEEQRAAAERILEKYPMTDEEVEMYERLIKSPDEYLPPKEVRVCGVCGAEFQDIPAHQGRPVVSKLEQFSDHMAEHNPSPGQWAGAYHRIQEARELSKGT